MKLEEKTMEELKKICITKKLKGYSRLNKKDLVLFLQNNKGKKIGGMVNENGNGNENGKGKGNGKVPLINFIPPPTLPIADIGNNIGNLSELSIPKIGFGTYIGVDEEKIKNKRSSNNRLGAVYTSVLIALNTGYRILDLAENYNNLEPIKQAIITSGISRKELFIIMKTNDPSISNIYRLLTETFDKDKDKYFDLVLWHHFDPNNIIKWNYFSAIKTEKLSRYIGISNCYQKGLKKLITYCSQNGMHYPDANEFEINLWNQQKDLVKLCKTYNILPIAYSPLGYKNYPMILANNNIQNIATKTQLPIPQILLKFLMDQGILVIPSSEKEDHILENFNSTNIKLNKANVAILNNKNTVLFATWTAENSKRKNNYL